MPEFIFVKVEIIDCVLLVPYGFDNIGILCIGPCPHRPEALKIVPGHALYLQIVTEEVHPCERDDAHIQNHPVSDCRLYLELQCLESTRFTLGFLEFKPVLMDTEISPRHVPELVPEQRHTAERVK